ncbi:dTDP-4-dehydrorhamnose 3,5-epimerase [Luteimonas sp. RD2P54]|uniref:dTDP-4-dehydrorhamnose 3,5-epimerase n=1 Tax=Luteimonas endophytica TaxID=3042023 RepID=A0ABT6JB46_9GAMM|nr:dTDP-4-dehydrorhamnose 3,5-epimerase [Luteimonas endophytica]MDH5824056.1 dTDP-4-dehydrorhamnose 3,5-epimerase [Luteimonas endophytica]
MKLVETGLPGCLVIEPRVFEDARGSFHEAFNLDALAAQGLGLAFVQGNVSTSSEGVLRGLHYQWPGAQGKYVSVLQGEAWDVAVDIRRGSPTFGRWTAVLLSAGNRRQFWIPEGFAHGFVALAEHVVFTYLCTSPYDAEADAAIRWDDPDLAIDWPVAAPRLSEKDARAPLLAEIAEDRLPRYDAAGARALTGEPG